MAYISRLLAKGETLIGVSRLHWIHLAQGLLWLVSLMVIGFMIDWAISMMFGALIPSVQWAFFGMQSTWLELFFIGCGILIFLVYYIEVATTEVALTNERIIHKWGWIFVKVKEMTIDEIKGSHINLGMLGRFLGYGQISLDAKFVKDAQLPWINKPYRFARALSEAQEAIEQRMTMVIENAKPSAIRLRPADNVNRNLPDNRPTHMPPENIDDPQVTEFVTGKDDIDREHAVEENPAARIKADRKGQNFEDKPLVSMEKIEKALKGETVSIKMPAVLKQKDISEHSDKQKEEDSAPKKDDKANQSEEKEKSEKPKKAKKPSQQDEPQPEQESAPDDSRDEEAPPPIDPDNRPQAEPHPVAEGSYEEEKLKEELLEEFAQTIETDSEKTATDTFARRVH